MRRPAAGAVAQPAGHGGHRPRCGRHRRDRRDRPRRARPGAVADAPEPDDGLDKPGKEPGAGKPAPVAQRAAAAIDPTATDKLAYRVRIAAGNGAPVAELDGEPTRTHLVQLGDDKALEGHAVLGRGWAQAIAAAEARAAEVAKPAAARVVEHLGLARDRLTAIEKRLAMLTRKA
ncbi:MAG: hypothetical protein HS111_19980 [Kofleriaceae bacterium]|nr:hypothetical protein [Kofleriaceae bacterium]